jgi:hypothetical protein
VAKIGLNSRTIVNTFRTPHSEKLHVVEGRHLIDGGNKQEVNITVETPTRSIGLGKPTNATSAGRDRSPNMFAEQHEPLRLSHAGSRRARFLSGKAKGICWRACLQSRWRSPDDRIATVGDGGTTNQRLVLREKTRSYRG